jgi:hypothetical protein
MNLSDFERGARLNADDKDGSEGTVVGAFRDFVLQLGNTAVL